MTLTSCPLTSRLHTARSHTVVLLFCLVLCASLSVSQSLGADKRLGLALQTSSFPSVPQQLSSPLSVSLRPGRGARRASPSACCRVRASTRTDSPLCDHAPSPPPPCGHGWSSDTNEALPGDNQCPPDCKRLHVCLRGPPAPLSLSDCKQASGVPHRRRNNKKGDLRAFSSVCVCVCLLGRVDL